MTVQNIFPNSALNSGIKPLLSNQYMLSFFKKFCDEIRSRMWRLKKARNARYEKEDFLRVFFFSEMVGRSIHDTSEMLNEYFLSKKRGRRKTFTDGRNKRLIPHQTEVNKFLRQIGLKRAGNILRECLFHQLKEALDLNVISQKVNVLIDFTEHPYYGKRDDKMIKGTNRQKGTKKMRHYLGFSILSRNIHLYAGLEQIALGHSKIPIIIKFLDHLLNLGFELKYVLMDREFYRVELLDDIKRKGGNVLIPAKSYKKIKQIIADYLSDNGGRVRKYAFSTATEAKRRFSQNVYLIIRAKREFSLQGIKRDFQDRKISLKDAQRRVFTIMTTEKPKGKTSSWASRVSLFYRRRWLIETGFSDLNRINRRWKSNHDNVRYLDILARMLLYNSWKINKKLIQNHAKKEGKIKSWTLNQNQDCLKQAFLSLEKKSLGVTG
ncbi:MAG: transposase [Candidatus Lokiarchaeia archaeon]